MRYKLYCNDYSNAPAKEVYCGNNLNEVEKIFNEFIINLYALDYDNVPSWVYEDDCVRDDIWNDYFTLWIEYPNIPF